MRKKEKITGDRQWYKYWPKHLPKTLDYPETPMFEVVETSARRYPEKPAIIYYGKIITYRELWESILSFAGYLNMIGIKKGDRVAIFLPNSPQFVIAYYGIMRANAIVVALDPMLSAEGIKELLNDSQSKAIVTMATSLSIINKIKNDTSLKKIIASEFADYIPSEPELPVPVPMLQKIGIGEEALSWKEVIGEKLDPPPIEVRYDDPSLIMYTSGTTGERKGALHTHWSMIVNSLRANYWLYNVPSTVHLAILPFFHVTGMHFCMTAPLYSGATLVILSRWDRETAIQAVEKYRCTHWTNITTMVVDMLSAPDIDSRDLSSFLVFGGGGSPVPKAIGEKLASMGIYYMEGYGLTEAGSGTHCNPLDRVKMQCLGIPIFDIDTKIIDPISGDELTPGNDGELVMISPSIFREFWNKPEETKKAFIEIDGEKWFRTGDLAHMDEDGYFFMVDRIKRLINRAGLKVWPAAIEGEYYKHPAIKEVCIIGTPDDRVGEEVKVYIVLKEGYEGKITEDEIKIWAKKRFAAYEYPRVVEFIKELPKSATGKILWRVLQAKEFVGKRS
jgi:acyl-CoA synthetase (AMP-forming)/AMP-acid ligase II